MWPPALRPGCTRHKFGSHMFTPICQLPVITQINPELCKPICPGCHPQANWSIDEMGGPTKCIQAQGIGPGSGGNAAEDSACSFLEMWRKSFGCVDLDKSNLDKHRLLLDYFKRLLLR